MTLGKFNNFIKKFWLFWSFSLQLKNQLIGTFLKIVTKQVKLYYDKDAIPFSLKISFLIWFLYWFKWNHAIKRFDLKINKSLKFTLCVKAI